MLNLVLVLIQESKGLYCSCKQDTTTILSNGTGHFGSSDRDNWTGQRGPPSKLVPNIPLRPNRNGPFHLMYNVPTKIFWNFGLNGKRAPDFNP